MRENVRKMGDELIFDFAYASLTCAECGLHLLLSPRGDQDELAETLLNITLSHSSQSLALCLTFASVELTQPFVHLKFLRPVVFEPVYKCEFCLRSGCWSTPMDVYQCVKCSAIISGESAVTEHIIVCHQIEKNGAGHAGADDDYEQLLNEYVFDNVEVLFVAGNFPFTRIRCDLCSTNCCSIPSLRRHYAQCHGILCAFQRNQSTIQECSAVLLRRDWANTGFDRELLQQINSSQPPKCTSEFESECDGNANLHQLGAVKLSATTLYTSLLHLVEQQQQQPKEQQQEEQRLEVDADDDAGVGQIVMDVKEEPMEEEEWEQEHQQHQKLVIDEQQSEAGQTPTSSSFDKKLLDDASAFSNALVKDELIEQHEEQESSECFLNMSKDNDDGDVGDLSPLVVHSPTHSRP
uniref:C2H2-type domain-containing protein n=1 Tax=Globodera pallida TaxID=36090 RepID=A0A183BHW5_GLOPA